MVNSFFVASALFWSSFDRCENRVGGHIRKALGMQTEC